MGRPRLAVCLDDLRAETKEAMELVRRLGFRAVDIGAVRGPVSPRELSTTGERHLLKHLADLGLALSSLRGPHSGAGYGDAASGERRLETMRSIIRLAGRLRVPCVSTSLGRSTGLEGERRMREAVSILADDGSREGVTVAVETTDLATTDLARMLAEFNCPFLAACSDSGAMLMAGEDPHELGGMLAGKVVLARARDAVAGLPGRPGHEVPLGRGGLDPARYLAGLERCGLSGDVILTRTEGDAAAELQQARLIFDRLLSPA